MNITKKRLKLLKSELFLFDMYYEYSDDGMVHSKAIRHKEFINTLFDRMGFDELVLLLRYAQKDIDGLRENKLYRYFYQYFKAANIELMPSKEYIIDFGLHNDK